MDPDDVEPLGVRVQTDGGEAGVCLVWEVARPGEGGQELRVVVTCVVTVQTEVCPLPQNVLFVLYRLSVAVDSEFRHKHNI